MNVPKEAAKSLMTNFLKADLALNLPVPNRIDRMPFRHLKISQSI